MSIAFELELAPDRILRGTAFPSQHESQGVVIVCHGYKGFKDWGFFPYLGEQLATSFDVITFNFTHNGVGEDPFTFTELDKFACNTYTRELEDLEFLVNAVRQGRTPLGLRVEEDVYLLGHSRGAGDSLLYALEHPGEVAGVISWNGITNVDLYSDQEKADMREHGRAYVLNGRTKQHMPLDRVLLEDLEANAGRFDILGRIQGIQPPVVLIQGTEDSARLRKGSAALTELRPDIPWLKVSGGNHTFGAVHPFQGITEPLEEAIRLTQQWLTSQTMKK
ncbi:alpha/beta fold hydrolase [Gorillibacterium sp. CAU 1737]|uniref:alpha/beta hydrolase family protein n=1 Tax=Gorillibacterium sp. CAU 1737 TaxID=3140362 RepID=UPI003260C2DA